MEHVNFKSKSVKDLQQYLKDRGVIFSDQRKVDLVQLCENCLELKIEIDPDGLVEDRTEILNSKLLMPAGTVLPNPDTLTGSSDISILPPVGIFDIYNYLTSSVEYDLASLRNYDKMETYGMFLDGYVLHLESVTLNEYYTALRARVRPRTNEKDPVSKLGYYKLWVVFSKTEEAENKGTIHSALCSCKGGIDGMCRHVVTTLFEVTDYLDDKNQDSVTSGPCVWVRRSTKTTEPVLVTELETELTATTSIPKPLEETFMPLPPGETLPDPNLLLDRVRETLPNACILDAYETRVPQTVQTPPVGLPLPLEKTEHFWTGHSIMPFHTCGDQCYSDFIDYLQYTSDNIIIIETATKGQNENPNWKLARQGIITSSNFKTVCHSTDFNKSATALLSGSSLDESNLPEPILYGRKFEKRAREIFIKSHRYRHRKCQVTDVGLIISAEFPMLGTSPDGIVDCSICGTFLVEVKCMYKYRNFFPRPALLASKICGLDENDDLHIEKTHQYHYQIQGQMGITGIHKCVLIGYTRHGVCPVTVHFDADMWREMHTKLSTFYKDYYLQGYLKNKDLI